VAVGVSTLILPAFAEPDTIIERERQRRAENTRLAREALIEGDEAYRLANYAKAVEEYTEAYDLVPDSMRTAEMRAIARERLAQAAVERARQLAKIGEIEKADSLLGTILETEVAPNYAPARQMREQIHDPIRYNPAMTPAHVRDVDRVRRLLYEAQGFADLGQFDRAVTVYEEVLRTDRYNIAARRGMEAATRHKQVYYRSAYDETRGDLLGQVNAAWEMQVPKPVVELDVGVGPLGEILGGVASASEKLDSIIVPVVDLDQVDLAEAIDFLRQQSRALDTFELDQDRRGVAFVIELGTGDPERTRRIEGTRFNLKLHNLPLAKVLEYITDSTTTTARIDEHAVVIRPAGAVGDELVTRQFRVPPDFLSREALEKEGGEVDPFGDEAPERGLVKRLTAQQFFKQQGVSLPAGAAVNYSPSTSVLSVRNTLTNMRVVEQIVAALADAEPIMITVEARIIRTSQNAIEELGFDWLLGAPSITDELFLSGGTVGNGTGITNNPTLHPITSGNRSGTLATETNAINNAINKVTQAEGLLRAPASIQALGSIDNQTVGALMRGVDQKKGFDLLTNKSVITRSGQSATIHSIQEFIYPTEYEPPELPNQINQGFAFNNQGQLAGAGGVNFATPATPTAFETTTLGCTLEVLPQIGEDGNIVEVAIKPEIRQFDGFIDYGTPINGGSTTTAFNLLGAVSGGNFGQITQNSILMPVFSTIRGNTTLTIRDGQTVVLGGMLKNSRVKVEDRVPLLGSIPLFGRLFSSQAYTTERDAYVILVTVRLQDPAGELVNRR